jgi:hypothetical protein
VILIRLLARLGSPFMPDIDQRSLNHGLVPR